MMKPAVSVYPDEMCKFCYTNGESLQQCYSHRLRDATGLVSCPVLRAFICPQVLYCSCLQLVGCQTFNYNHFCVVILLCFVQCGATGDHAHTVSYCPENRDGRSRLLQGASLSELKKKKNAAGRYGRSRRLPPPAHVSTPPLFPDHSMSSKYPMSSKCPEYSMSSKYPMSSKCPKYPMSSKYPEYNVSSLQQGETRQFLWEPDCVQLSLYHHYQRVQFYR